MELNVGILLHGHLEGVRRLGKEHISAVLVFGEIQGLTHLEISELRVIVARNPRGLVKRNRLITARSIVFVQETILNYLELQLTHSAYNLSSRHLTRKELSHSLVSQLFQALGKLLRLHRVGILHIAELLGRETRDALIVSLQCRQDRPRRGQTSSAP